MAIEYPLINGRRFSFASINATFDGQKIIGFRSINYDATLEIGKVYGTASQKLGRTVGREDSTGSFEMYTEEAKRLLAKLGDGFGRKAFDIVVQFAEDEGDEPSNHSLLGARIIKVGNAHSEGTDASMMSFDIDIMRVILDKLSLSGLLDTRGLLTR
jgi:hypothetical protein